MAASSRLRTEEHLDRKIILVLHLFEPRMRALVPETWRRAASV
jgi:hypothetical protein